MRILIIDNQYTQFEQLKSRIKELDRKKNEFEVFPEGEESFKSLLTSVKVFIYDGEKKSDDPDPAMEAKHAEYRQRAWMNILSYVNDCDIILMDFRLGSSLTCLTGLELSQKIWEEKDVPVLILSRDEQTREDISVDWKRVKEDNESRIRWLVKGYWGAELLPLGFVSANIVPEIRKLRATFVEAGQKTTLFDSLEKEISRLLAFVWSNNKDRMMIDKLSFIVGKKPQSCIEELQVLVIPLQNLKTTRLDDNLKKQIQNVLYKYDRESIPGIFTQS